MASGVSQQLPVYQPPSSIAVQLLLLSAAVALQVVAVIVLVKLLLQKSRAQERQQLAEERQGLTADPADGRSSAEIRASQKESDVLRHRAEGHHSGGSPWLAPRHRVVVGCCFGGFICCTISSASIAAPFCERPFRLIERVQTLDGVRQMPIEPT